METREILVKLKAQGARMTKTRRFVVEVVASSNLPLSELQIRSELARRGTSVNKTTVYRELEFLRCHRLVQVVDFGDGKKRYELTSDNHHHHLICTNCNRVDDIHVEDDVENLVKRISRQKQFKTTHHALEFFGICKHCNK